MNNQQVTKILNYFRLNYDFHSPYSFIVDGNFLKILIEKDINLQQKLKPVIPGKFKLKVTQCTLQQLDILGHSFHFIRQKAKQMHPIKCSHTFQPVDRCILQNSQKQTSLIVCSQDKNLRRRLRRKGVGIMYFGPDQRITMEDIQRKQVLNMKQMQKQKFMPTQLEKQKINQYKSQQQVIQKIKKRKQQKKFAETRGIDLKYLKKKIAKAPNPLSVKKKRRADQAGYNQSKQGENKEGQTNDNQIQKKKRIRKRNKKKDQNQNN